ncbi:MAG: hypothetical protein ACLRSL_04000 [Streptococcus sp.]
MARELQGLTEGRAQALLRGIMHLCLMPRDLSGTVRDRLLTEAVLASLPLIHLFGPFFQEWSK